MKLVQLGPLSAVLTSASPLEPVHTWVVLLHGFGAPADDLVGLAAALAPLPGVQFVFPGAPHALDGSAMAGAGRAWWHIDMLELQTARLSGAFNELSRAVPPGLAAARDALSSALASLSEQHGMRPERLVLGGFSQGAMLACDYAIRSAHPLLGLVQLSGTTLCADDWQRLLPARRGLRVLQSHSPDDLVLPMVLAERLQEWMVTAGLAHEFVSFRGGHGISQQVLRHLRAFVASLV